MRKRRKKRRRKRRREGRRRSISAEMLLGSALFFHMHRWYVLSVALSSFET